MSQSGSPIYALITCTVLGALISIWFIHVFTANKLRLDKIQPIDGYEPLISSPFISDAYLSLIRCLIAFISIIVLFYDIYVLNKRSLDPPYVWSWLFMILYFLLLSTSKIFNCLSAKQTYLQRTLRALIYTLYHIQLPLSFLLFIFVWIYLCILSPKSSPLQQHAVQYATLMMVSCNFLFIWSDFFINDISLHFHYTVFSVFLAWIYLLFSYISFTTNPAHINMYPFLDPYVTFNSLYYLLWILAHFISCCFVYRISCIKMKYQHRPNQLSLSTATNTKQQDIERQQPAENAQFVPSTTTISIDPDGTFHPVIPLSLKPSLSAEDGLTECVGITMPMIDEDDFDELSPLASLQFHADSTQHALSNVFVHSTKQYIITVDNDHDDEDNEHDSDDDYKTLHSSSDHTKYKHDEENAVKARECLLSPHRNTVLSRQTSKSSSRKYTTSSLPRQRSVHERVNSVTILADVQSSIMQQREAALEYKSKIQRIEQELIETEESYIEGLHCLMNEFITPIFEKKMIDLKYRRDITCNIPQIISFHEHFLEELLIGPICRVFSKQSDYFKIYIPYIVQYERILNIFARFKKNAKLKMYLSIKRKQNKALTNYLIAPIQRIPRYMLLLSELKKNTPKIRVSEYQDIECALKKVEEICDEINEKQREIENRSQCLQISQELKGIDDINIVEAYRKYLAHFVFKRKGDKRNRQFFVFNDIVIIANPKMEAKKIVNLRYFEAKKRINIKNHTEEVMVHIGSSEKDHELYPNKAECSNGNYDGPVAYLSCDDIAEKDNHEDISNIDVFVALIMKYRDKLFMRDLSRSQRMSHNQDLQLSLELIELMREKQDQEKLKDFEQSSMVRGASKLKVLSMLGSKESIANLSVS